MTRTKIGVMVAILLLGLVSTQSNAIADDDSKKPKTLESECAKKKQTNFDGLLCQAVLGLNTSIDSFFDVFAELNADNTFVGTQTFQANSPAIIVQGSPAQTTNLQEWQDSSGAVLSSVGPTGTFSGAHAGDGSGLTNLDADTLDGKDSTELQMLVTGRCGEGSSIRQINPDGSVVCELDDAGASTNADTLDGIDSTSFAQLGNMQTFTGANTFSNIGNVFTGTHTGDGSGLTNLNADSLGGFVSSQYQKAIVGLCPPGQYIRIINADGSVLCDADAVGAPGGSALSTYVTTDATTCPGGTPGVCSVQVNCHVGDTALSGGFFLVDNSLSRHLRVSKDFPVGLPSPIGWAVEYVNEHPTSDMTMRGYVVCADMP